MAEKLHQNRGVILGLTQRDAATYRNAPQVQEDDVVFVGSAAQKLVLRGSLAGMHVRTVYITPHAAQGLNYEVALEALDLCLRRAGGKTVQLESRG